MNATPIADLPAASASTAQGAQSDKGALADLLFAQLDPATADPRAASTFAALLQDAALGTAGEPADERLPANEADAATGPVAQALSPLDTLLFLANLPVAQAAATAPAVQAGASQSPDVPADDDHDFPVLTAVVMPSTVVDGDTSEAVATTPLSTSRAAPIDVAAGGDAEAQRSSVPVIKPETDFESTLQRDGGPLAATNGTVPSSEGTTTPAASAIHTPAVTEPAPFPLHVQHAGAALRSDAMVQVDTPVTHPAWRDEAAERIASLVTRGVDRAELRLSPAELGPVEVRIDVRGSEATLAIVAAHATTRDALEQALPALRDLLSQQGLSLGEATVRDGRADGQASPERGARDGARVDDAGSVQRDEPPAGLRRSVRLVDTFA